MDEGVEGIERPAGWEEGEAVLKERPIIFNSWAVRAILDGVKCQTRRPVKPQPCDGWNPVVGPYCPTKIDRHGEEYPGKEVFGAADENEGRVCPFGIVEDRLWVRTSWYHLLHQAANEQAWDEFTKTVRWKNAPDRIIANARPHIEIGWKHRPSIHLPRWASRITLEIQSIRVERVQEISEEDAIAEGIRKFSGDLNMWGYDLRGTPGPMIGGCAAEAFCHLWNSIYGAGAWERNDWVWVLEFRRITE